MTTKMWSKCPRIRHSNSRDTSTHTRVGAVSVISNKLDTVLGSFHNFWNFKILICKTPDFFSAFDSYNHFSYSLFSLMHPLRLLFLLQFLTKTHNSKERKAHESDGAESPRTGRACGGKERAWRTFGGNGRAKAIRFLADLQCSSAQHRSLDFHSRSLLLGKEGQGWRSVFLSVRFLQRKKRKTKDCPAISFCIYIYKIKIYPYNFTCIPHILVS